MVTQQFKPWGTPTSSLLSTEILCREHLVPLARSLISPTTWFAKTRGLNTVEKFVEYFEKFIDRQARGETLTIVAHDVKTNGPCAMSTFQFLNPEKTKVEIGFTWIADSYHGTKVNPELKRLMLDYAFKTLGVRRVEFCVHPDNAKSNRAMQKLGATLEGRLRAFRFLPGDTQDGGDRHMYSIIATEWSALNQSLIGRIKISM